MLGQSALPHLLPPPRFTLRQLAKLTPGVLGLLPLVPQQASDWNVTGVEAAVVAARTRL